MHAGISINALYIGEENFEETKFEIYWRLASEPDQILG